MRSAFISRCHRGILLGASGLAIGLGSPLRGSVAAQEVSRTPVEATIPEPPTEARALGRSHLVYEIHLTNFGRDTLQLTALLTTDADRAGAVIDVAAAAGAPAIFVGPAVPRSRGALTIPPGRRLVLLRWLTLGTAAPASIAHQLVFAETDTLSLPAKEVRRGGGPRIEAPVAAGRWVAVRGPSNASGHRASLVPLHGHVAVPQRFAVDWVRLGEDGRLFAGDPAENRSWHGYGTPVLAAEAGVVVGVRDGIAENEPLALAGDARVDADVAPGNRVVVLMSDGGHAMYAHLQPGSLRVREGDRVAAGDTLGSIGNSGNSLAPHLHFDITNRPGALEGEGLPFRLRAFRLVGRLDSLQSALDGSAWAADDARPARNVADEIPLENMVIELGS
jgi:hypothetical protein